MVTDLKDAILERFKNPFLGSWIVIWLVLNWKSVFYLLFSDLSIETRFYNIEHHYYSFFRSILLPPILAFIYTSYKDYFFHYVEKESRESRKLRRISKIKDSQEVYTEREELETIKARTKHIAEEYKVRNELTVKINDLEKTILNNKLEHQELIDNLKRDNEKTLNLKQSYQAKVELILHRYSENIKISEFRNTMTKDAIIKLGVEIDYLYQNSNHKANKKIKDIALNIQEYELGKVYYNKEEELKFIDLTILGQYVYHRHLYSHEDFNGEKLPLDPVISKPPIQSLF